MTTSEQWERLNVIFHEATALDPAQRKEYLDTACGDDAELRTEAERLIVAHERADRFIETPVIAVKRFWPDVTSDEVEPGRLLGPYRILSEIARGGMGAVYLAERADGQYQQRVAVKLIKRGMDADLMLRRFRAERQILASLEHPNIARLLDGGTSEDGLPYFVMEYIAGAPINEFVRSRALAVAERLTLFLAVCDAVAHAHRRGVIHRDIKPANILVTPEGIPKLLDFGIAKALSPDAPGSTAPITGLRLLTPEYASPEQVEGKTATSASDVYSLGVVLYELLTGSSPYKPRSRDPLDVADAVRTTIPERPSAGVPRIIRRQLKGDLDTIVLVALRKEPERRYQSVDDLAGDIRRHLHGLPITARRDSVGYRTGKFLKRNRTPAVAAGAAVLITSLVGGGVAMLRTPAENSLRGGPLAARDRIVVSRFTEQQGDTMLAAAISEAFRIDLSQSPNVRVLTPAQVRGALQRMEVPGTSIPHDSVARDLAVREGAKAYVSGSIARIGGTWTIAVQLTSTEGGEALLAVSETARDSSHLIAAVGRASRELRQRLGESLRDLRDMPVLERATTASIPALRKYTEAQRVYMNGGDRLDAIRLYEEAAALDSGFALAHSGVAVTYAALAEPGRALAARLQALAHSDRLPFRERGIMLAQYAFTRNDYPATIAEYQRLLQRYPNDVPILNNLALAYRDIRQFAKAETLWTRAIALDSAIVPLYYGLHSALVPHGRVADGRSVLDIVRRRTPNDALLPVTDVQQAAAEQDWDSAERLAHAHRLAREGDTLQLVDAYEQLAGIAMTQGRSSEAERYWRAQFVLSTRSESYGRRLFAAMQLGLLELRYNRNPARARVIVDSVIALKPLGDILPADRPYEALARFYAQAGDVAHARALLAAADSNNKALDRLMTAEIAWSRGEIALATGDVRTAEQELRVAATTHWCTICALPSLARAYDAAGKSEPALATYREYLSSPWLWRYENDAIEIGHVLRRMGELYERAGQPDSARRAWSALVRLWRNADGAALRERLEVETLLKELR
jgi:serine/threonine protein kinase/tetratricopeptide (TPR) repeat protein